MPRATRQLIVALDVGHTRASAAVIDINGDRVTSAHAPLSSHPDPTEWLDAATAALTNCLEAAGPSAHGRIAGLGLTGTMGPLVLLPSTTPTDLARPEALAAAPAVDDAASQAESRRLNAALPVWSSSSGNPHGSSSQAVAWARLAALDDPKLPLTRRIVCGPAGFIAWALGLGAWVDQTSATTTGLARHDGLTWLPEVAALAHVPQRVLPGIVGESTSVLGPLVSSAATRLGLPEGIPVVLAPGDVVCATLGMIGLATDSAALYLGRHAWMSVIHRSTRPIDPTLTTLPAGTRLGARPGAPASASVTFASLPDAGVWAEWGRAVFLGGASEAQAEAACQRWEAAHGRVPTGVVVAAGAGGGLAGVGPGTAPDTLYRAVLEGVACDAARAWAALDLLDPSQPVTVAGGANGPAWARIIADILGLPVRAASDTDVTTRGAAMATASVLGLTHKILPVAADPRALAIEADAGAHATYNDLAWQHQQLREMLAPTESPTARRTP